MDALLTEVNNERYREEVALRGPEALAEYDGMVKGGQTPQFAAMLINRSFPSTVTDKQFFSGIGMVGDQIKDPVALRAMRKEYRRQTGKDPNPNMVYVPSMVPTGRMPGHPDAWVDRNNARSQLKKTARKRNIPLMGRGLNQPAVEVEPTPGPPIADDIVKRMVRDVKVDDPATAKGKSDTELREMVIDRHSRK